MTPHLVELVIAVLLAAGFAAVGETVLGERSGNIIEWTQSLLVGAGLLSAILFPLSLIWPRGSLRAVLGTMAVAVASLLWRRHQRRSQRNEPPPRQTNGAWDVPSAVLFALIAAVALAFSLLELRTAVSVDGFLAWASKAQLLYYQGALGREWYPGFAWESRVLPYPPLVPLYQALIRFLRGSFEFDGLQPVFVVLYLAMLVSTYSAARAVVSRPRALSAVLLLALLPALWKGSALAGYADMPQAAFVAGTVAAGLREGAGKGGWRSPLAWLIGSLTTVKSEGVLIAILACVTVAVVWLFDRSRPFFARALAERRGATIIAAFLILRCAYVRWVHAPWDGIYGPLDATHISRALRLLRPVAGLCLAILLDPWMWGFLWPVFALALLALLSRGSPKEKGLGLATVAGVACFSAIFLFTNWPVEVHVPDAYDRLLVQLAPAAVVSLVLAYARSVSTAVGGASPS